MTSAEFATRFRVLKQVAERGARTHVAQQLELGRIVLVHYLDRGGPGAGAQLFDRVRALPAGAQDKVVETVLVDDVPVVVTLFATALEDLAGWVSSQEATAPGPVSAPVTGVRAENAASAARTPGAFTSMFGSVANASKPDEPSSPSPAPPAPAPNQAAPGEFTRVFLAGGAPPSPAPHSSGADGSVPLPWGAEPERSIIPQPARHDQMTAAPEAPSPPAAPTGEFTQLFQRLGSPVRSQDAVPEYPVTQPAPSSRPVPTPPPVAQPAPSPPLMTSPQTAPPPLPLPSLAPFAAPTPPAAPVFKAPAFPMSAEASTSYPTPSDNRPIIPFAVPPAGSVPPSPTEGSEFTRVLGRVSPPQTATPAQIAVPIPAQPARVPPTASAESAAPRRSMVPLIIVLNVILIATAAVIIYFVLRR